MIWFDWVIVGVWIVAIIGTISNINKVRKPLSTDGAIAIVLFQLLFIGLMLWSHGALG